MNKAEDIKKIVLSCRLSKVLNQLESLLIFDKKSGDETTESTNIKH
jgi:hypothetical protein